MSVRKRRWTTREGIEKEAWVVDYADQQGVRRLKTFSKKKEAAAYEATTHVEIRHGEHVAENATVTIQKAGEMWIATGVDIGLERSTLDQYRQHLELHITSFIGGERLSKLSMPFVRAFQDRLREEGRSPAMVRRVTVSLGSILADAQERGLVSRNVVREMTRRRIRGKSQGSHLRRKERLQVGTHIPAPDEIKRIVAHLQGRWRPLIVTAIFTGLRASELRGLQWGDVDFGKSSIHVRRRADRYNEIGEPKSNAGRRTIPLPPMVINALREWKLKYPRPIVSADPNGDAMRENFQSGHLVFPNGRGNVESLANIINRGLIPPQIEAGITADTGKLDADGTPIVKAKYTGMHRLRHFYASWLINRKEDGGIGLTPKLVQERMGHSTITMTLDVYGHLFPREHDPIELAEAERALLA